MTTTTTMSRFVIHVSSYHHHQQSPAAAAAAEMAATQSTPADIVRFSRDDVVPQAGARYRRENPGAPLSRG